MKPGIFTDENGVPSSKRITSFVCIAVAIVIAFTVRDFAIATAFLSAGVALQGVSMISESGK